MTLIGVNAGILAWRGGKRMKGACVVIACTTDALEAALNIGLGGVATLFACGKMIHVIATLCSGVYAFLNCEGDYKGSKVSLGLALLATAFAEVMEAIGLLFGIETWQFVVCSVLLATMVVFILCSFEPYTTTSKSFPTDFKEVATARRMVVAALAAMIVFFSGIGQWSRLTLALPEIPLTC